MTNEIYQRGEEYLTQMFTPSMRYSDDGYDGYLDRIGITCEVSYRVDERQVEREAFYKNQPNPDILYIPQLREYEIADAAYAGARTNAVLEMTAVTWEHEGYDESGRPLGYTAAVTYRGLERELVSDYVTVTATYEGTVSRLLPEVGQTEEKPLPASPPLVQVSTLAAPQVANSPAPEPVWSQAVAMAVLVVLLGALALLILARYWNVRLVAVGPQEASRTVCRKHVRIQKGVATFVIPDQCALTSLEESHQLRVKPSLAAKQGVMSIVWRGRHMMIIPLEREIDLQQRLLALASSGLLAEESSLDACLPTSAEGGAA
ncbi:MAG: hypothetical protein LBD25_08315 [Coriobacteriales bacterium]|nr:hypothetical protein [Coriobacteriales bacterium]